MSYYLGLMSGTSFDGVDVALINDDIKLIDSDYKPYPTQLKQAIRDLCYRGNNEIERQLILNHKLANFYADSVNEFFQHSPVSCEQISAIGCHGQSVRHFIQKGVRYTLQLGCANTLAYKTGIKVVDQFRLSDIAAGGEGAPLAPLLHKKLFHQPGHAIAIINIGGIANITWINKQGTVIGYDCGPGNCLLDDWARLHLNKDYDSDGKWSLSGRVISELVNAMLDDSFFIQPSPKSLDRHYFDLAFLNAYLKPQYKAEDVQASLIQLSVQAIKQAILEQTDTCQQVLICGGGVNNKALMYALKQALPTHTIVSTATVGVCPDSLEAMLMAYLAKECVDSHVSDTSSITGAERAVVLGSMTHP